MLKEAPPLSSAVSQPHDKLVKKLLSNPDTAIEILNLYLPSEVRALVDLTNLSLQRDSFIEKKVVVCRKSGFGISLTRNFLENLRKRQ